MVNRALGVDTPKIIVDNLAVLDDNVVGSDAE
jgi:hypothetical protein